MSVSWTHIARKDIEDAARSRLLWGLTAAFAVLMSLFLVIAYSTEGGDVEPIEVFTFLAGWSQFFVPLIALIVGYMAIVGERQSGSIRLLLSYPFSRAAIVSGKVVGRTIVVIVSVLGGFLVVSTVGVILVGVPPLADIAGIVGLTVVLALTFTAVAVGISAGTSSRGMAMALTVGLFFLLLILWEAIAVGAYFAVHGTRPGLTVDAWYLLLRQLNPIEAYRAGLSSIAGEYVWPLLNLGLEDIPMEADAESRMTGERVAGGRPVYLRTWFTGVIYLAWIALPIALGYRRFRHDDL